MSPFPIFLEAPVLNPCLKHEYLIREILENAGHIEDSDIKILEQILMKNPQELKESYLLEKLQGLINKNTQLVI